MMRRDDLRPYVRDLADRMGMRDWDVRLVDDAMEPGPTVDAQSKVYYGQRRIDVWIAEHHQQGDAAFLRLLVVHELLHAHLDPMDEPLESLRNSIGETVYHPLTILYRNLLERSCDAIAVAWAQTLPLPPATDADQQEAA